MVLNGLDVVHLAPYLRETDPQLGREIIKPRLLEINGRVRHSLERLPQDLHFTTQGSAGVTGVGYGFTVMRSACCLACQRS
jgi:phage terminase large subunit